MHLSNLRHETRDVVRVSTGTCLGDVSLLILSEIL